MKKRGQFYLLAALIIAIILFGTAAITNRSSKKEYSVVYDLSKEIDLEGALLREYGVVNALDLSDTFEEFLQKYSQYISDSNVELYFIYGNQEEVYLLAKSNVGNINLGESSISLQGTKKQDIKEYKNQTTGKVNVKFGKGKNEFEREFDVQEGEYFYYAFTQETIEGEIHTVTS